MIPSQKCIDLIKQFEGFEKTSYKCPAGIWTIGYGSTMWNDGRKVEQGQKITLEGGEMLLRWELKNKSSALIGLTLNQNQYDALLSFIYNLGVGAFKKSTLYKKVKINANDDSIRDEFMKWNKARVNGKLVELKGLTNRRKSEINLYYEV
jgi:lysozyme